MRGTNNYQVQMNITLTPAVRALLILNLVVWLGLIIFLQGFVLKNNFIFKELGLAPAAFLFEFKLWQPLTYMFLHAESVFHILFNSLIIWMIGSELEKLWGSKEFIKYYLICGAGAGILFALTLFGATQFFDLNPALLHIPTVGASGAVFALMLAYGYFFGERPIYFMMLFPMKAKHFVMILAFIEVMTLINSGFGGRVNNLAHIGGFIVGFLYLSSQRYIRKYRQDRWFKKPGRKLKLVVDNEEEKASKGPTYH